jgi:putative endonuclease
MRTFYVYILASRTHRLYVGVTNDLVRRIYEHRSGASDFTRRYRITRLVYFETTGSAYSAITREKQIKGLLRKKKIDLIERSNPKWNDLAANWLDGAATADPSLRSG